MVGLFEESMFRGQVDRALAEMKTVLDNERRPTYAADVQHTYDDKYLLAEFLTNSASAGLLNCLDFLGLTEKQAKQLQQWASDRSVTLEFTSEERCTFDRKATRKVEPSSSTEHVTSYQSSSGFKSKWTSKTVKKVTEWFWKFDVTYEIAAYRGAAGSKDRIILQRHEGHCEIVTSSDAAPRPEVQVVPAKSLQITWLLQQLTEDLTWRFTIDRNDTKCHTPRRNSDSEAAIAAVHQMIAWCQATQQYMRGLLSVEQGHELDLGAISASGIHVPVAPLFEDRSEKKSSRKRSKEKEAEKNVGFSSLPADSDSVAVLPFSDLNEFLALQRQGLQKKFSDMDQVFPLKGKLVCQAAAKLMVPLLHAVDVATAYYNGMDYIESMIRQQLIAAIGKEVTSTDFDEYLRFHYRKLLKDEYQPRPFCFAVRRPDHSPEGTLSIEAARKAGDVHEPIVSIVRQFEGKAQPMSFPISAATRVTFGGDRYLHGWMAHEFAGRSGVTDPQLIASTRQFSGFIMLVGRIAGADKFIPKAAVLLQNKDELRIPLDLEQIPTAKAFKKAVESLSPEMRRFATAFRSMQLESTLFGVVVIQIKPQLERLLKLPDDSLTKEIRLTQDLLELFIKYQIPSDLLSYDGDEGASKQEKIDCVKIYVKRMQDMILGKKETELKDVTDKTKYGTDLYDDFSSESDDDEGLDYDDCGLETSALEGYGGGGGGGGFSGLVSSLLGGVSRSMSSRHSEIACDSASIVEEEECEAFCGDEPELEMDMCKAEAPEMKEAVPKMEEAAPVADVDEVKADADGDEVKADANSDDAEKKERPKSELQEQEVDEAVAGVDFTQFPTTLNKRMEKLDVDDAVRPTIVHPGSTWTKRAQASLLAVPSSSALGEEQQRTERNTAYDLLDALSRSGSLPIEHASLHVLVASTHCFVQTLLSTLVEGNVNPIEKFERSTLIVATTIHEQDADALVRPERREAAAAASPALFADHPPIDLQ